jgi:hypothetical protein
MEKKSTKKLVGGTMQTQIIKPDNYYALKAELKALSAKSEEHLTEDEILVLKAEAENMADIFESIADKPG